MSIMDFNIYETQDIIDGTEISGCSFYKWPSAV